MSPAIKHAPDAVKLNAFLREKADWVRRQTLMIHKTAPETRVASSLSPVEIFTALYYGGAVAFDPKQPHWDGRDRVVISKGHGSLSMYPILADLGFFAMEELANVCRQGSFLGGIPDPIIPGYETVNGSLGHGVGVACGMAKAMQALGKSHDVYAVTGDGELHEGSIWEGFLFASQHKLDGLTVIVDRNKHCMLGTTESVIALEPLAEKLEAFGFTTRTCDGHDVGAVNDALMTMKLEKNGKPKALIAETLKGKGAPQLETNPLSHITGLKPEEIDEILKRGK